MGMHVFSLLKIKHTLKRNLKDKSRDADWDFGARQSPPDAIDTSSRRDNSVAPRRSRSASLDGQRPQMVLTEPQEQQHGQQKRDSDLVGSSVRGPRGDSDEGRVKGSRSGSPEDDVLLAAGESAKEVRTAVKPADQRRRIHSIAVVRPVDASMVPLPASPTTSRFTADSPTPSVQAIHSVRSGRSDASLLSGKRSMPQLHNVWENFLEEAAEDVNSFAFRLPPHSPSKFATVHISPRTDASQSLRHHHTSTSSSSSASTTTTSESDSTVKALPRNSPSGLQSQSSDRLRPRNYMRASHHTSSSTSSTTPSIAGSTSSIAAFSSASSITTIHDECDDLPQACDGPVPATPRSSAALSPKSFKFADPSLSLPMAQRLRKSPTSPALQCRTESRGPSPASSTSSESRNSSTASFVHSQLTTPTHSSTCPTPSPTPDPVKQLDRCTLAFSSSRSRSKNNGQYRRSPEGPESPGQPSSPGLLLKGRKSSSNFYRYSNVAGGSRVELGSSPSDDLEEAGDLDEDVLSELGYYGNSFSRAKGRGRRRSAFSTSSAVSRYSELSTPSETSLVPPLRRSSRQLLRPVGAQSAPLGDSMLIPRAKSASNIKHEANAALKRPHLAASHSSSLHLVKKSADSDTSGYPYEPRMQTKPLLHARSQTLRPKQVHAAGNDTNLDATVSVPLLSSWSKSGHGRLHSESTSVMHYHTSPGNDAKRQPPVRPPPAPPLDMSSTTLQPPASARRFATSPHTPLSAVQWGYAL